MAKHEHYSKKLQIDRFRNRITGEEKQVEYIICDECGKKEVFYEGPIR